MFNFNENTQPLIDELKNAYRYFKNYVYFSRTMVQVRQEIALFEQNPGQMEAIFKEVAFKLGAGRLEDYWASKINKISYIPLIKKYKTDGNDEHFIANISNPEASGIEKLNFFITMPIELFILDTWWASKISCLIQQEPGFEEHCFGNVASNCVANNDPALSFPRNMSFFKPYYHQYRKWQETAVQEVESLYDNGEDSLLISLDLSRFYYNADISFEELRRVCQPSTLEFTNAFNVMEQVYKSYSKKLSEVDCTIQKKTVLPLGLISAGILANHALLPLDLSLKQLHNCQQEVRYVDDILLVFSGDWKSALDKNSLVKEFLNKEMGKDNSLILDYGWKVQGEKIKVFAISANGPRTILEAIRDNPFSVSEIDLLSDEDLTDRDFLKRVSNGFDATKIRDIDDLSCSKTNLRIFLNEQIRMSVVPMASKETEPKEIENFFQQISKFFTSDVLMGLTDLWPQILLYAVCEKRGDLYSSICKEISNGIEGLRFVSSGVSDLSIFVNAKSLIQRVKEAACTLFENAENSAAAISPSFFQDNRLAVSTSSSSILRNANLVDHGALPLLLAPFIQGIPSSIDLHSLTPSSIYFQKHRKLDANRVFWSPRFIHYSDYLLFFLPRKMGFKKQVSEIDVTSQYNKEILRPLGMDPVSQHDEKINKSLTKVSFDEAEVPALPYGCNHIVGLINIKVELENLFFISNSKPPEVCYRGFSRDYVADIKRLLKTTEVTATRKGWLIPDSSLDDGTSTIVEGRNYVNVTSNCPSNQKESLDFVVFPELSVPLELIPTLDQFARQNLVGVVAGIASGPLNHYYVNFEVTIIPFIHGPFRSTVILLREKSPYSPAELSAVNQAVPSGRLLKRNPVYNSPCLVTWRDYNFASFICFELTDITKRSALRGYINVLFAIEVNRDVEYFSSIVQSASRDLSCFVVQVNTSEFGETRVEGPYHKFYRNMFMISHGETSSVNFVQLEIKELHDYLMSSKDPDGFSNDPKIKRPSANFKLKSK